MKLLAMSSTTNIQSLKSMDLAENAEAMAASKHEGFEAIAWDGLQ